MYGDSSRDEYLSNFSKHLGSQARFVVAVRVCPKTAERRQWTPTVRPTLPRSRVPKGSSKNPAACPRPRRERTPG